MPPRSAFFDFMDVGMGDCTFVRGPGGERMLIDFGSTRNRRVAPPDAIEYLRTHLDGKDPTLHYLVLTHSDIDHINQIDRLRKAIAGFKVDTLLYSGNEEDYGKQGITFAALKRVTTNIYPLADGYRNSIRDDKPNFTLSDMKVFILSANYPRKNSRDPNPKSIVLQFRFGGLRIILPGDATAATEKSIKERNRSADLQCFVLKVPHHGSLTSSSIDWVGTTRPSGIVISADNNPIYNLPRLKVINRYNPIRMAKHPIVIYDDEDEAFEEAKTEYFILTTLGTFDQGVQYQIELREDGEHSITST